MSNLKREAARVLDFWFGPPPRENRVVWFEKNDAFDRAIRENFAPLHEQAATGACDAMASNPKGSLALVIVLDQFSRNLFRDDPKAFACDDRALDHARRAIGRGFDRQLHVVERQFLYLPLEHCEDPKVQAESVALFSTIGGDALDFAQRHQEIIERFGRFPHRNAVLGRDSTAAELAFLQEPGSSF
ncbi:MAG: DUF924 family protein [Alphaproteobacteria bacterium]